MTKGPSKRPSRPSRRGAGILGYLLIAGAIAAGLLAHTYEGTTSKRRERSDEILVREANLLREFAEAALAKSITLQAEIERTYNAALESGGGSAGLTSRTQALQATYTYTPSDLVASGQLRSNFPTTLQSGTSFRAILTPRTGAGSYAPLDLLVHTTGVTNTQLLYGSDQPVERAIAARQLGSVALRRDPPSISGLNAESLHIGLIQPGTATLGATGSSPVNLGVFGYTAPQGVNDAASAALPQLGILVRAPGQYGFLLATLTARASGAVTDCYGSATGSQRFYACIPGTDVSTEICEPEEHYCNRQDAASPGTYASCIAPYRAAKPALPSSRRGYCSPTPACTVEAVSALAASNSAYCKVPSTLACSDGAARRIDYGDVAPGLSSLGFSFSCPASAIPLNASDLQAAGTTSDNPRRWSTVQPIGSAVTVCVPGYRHWFNAASSPITSTVSSNNGARAFVPRSFTYTNAGALIGPERTLALNNTRLSADWSEIQGLANNIYPKQAIDVCTGPMAEVPAVGLGPAEGDYPVPNFLSLRSLEISDGSGGLYVLYAFAGRVLTDQRAATDPRTVRLYDDWTIDGATATDAYQASRAQAYGAFANNIRSSAFAEFGYFHSRTSPAPAFRIEFPYNAPGQPADCASVTDITGSILPRSHRSTDIAVACPPRMGAPWTVTVNP